MKDFADLLENTLKLHPNERAFFAEEVLKSLESPNLEIDKSWEEEAIKRYEAYKNNKITTKNLKAVLRTGPQALPMHSGFLISTPCTRIIPTPSTR